MGGKLIPTAVFLTTLFGVVACSGSNSSDNGNTDPGTQMPGQTAQNAQGWQTIDMIADQAETKLDSLGHFDTSRNACGHEAYGILDLTLWNNIASESNQVLATAPLSEDHMNCFDSPDGNRMDGTVDFILVSPAPSHDLEPDTHASPIPHPTSIPTPHPSASPSPSPSPSILPKRSIYEVRGGQVCTTIQDTQLAKALLTNISTFVQLANKQDCANGYGN